METPNQPFALLPEALVDELLSRCNDVGNQLIKTLHEVERSNEKFRQQLQSAGLLRIISDLPDTGIPTTCGVDGSYVVERLMTTDLVACAAVAIEGLTPPIEKRHWETVRHDLFIDALPHNPDTTVVIQGVSWEMEICLASKAPHDVVFIDGSITNPFGKLNAAINKANENESKSFLRSNLKETLFSRFDSFLDSYYAILSSTRSDKLWVGCPKYTSLREIGEGFDWPENYDDRAMLTSILKAGEFTHPKPHAMANSNWHITLKGFEKSNLLEEKLKEIYKSIKRLHIVYYKPHSYIPAIRLEVPQSVVSNDYQMKMLLQAVEFQTRTPGIMEPYPLYMADRMVKNLSSAIPAFRQSVTNSMAQTVEGDLSNIFFTMHSYRTENG
jgi:hypothetical protein